MQTVMSMDWPLKVISYPNQIRPWKYCPPTSHITPMNLSKLSIPDPPQPICPSPPQWCCSHLLSAFWQICANHVLTSGAYFHFVTESNNTLLVHAEVSGKQEHGAPQGPQKGQQNLTGSPIAGVQRDPTMLPQPTWVTLPQCWSTGVFQGVAPRFCYHFSGDVLLHVVGTRSQTSWLYQKAPLLLLGSPLRSTIQERRVRHQE